MAYALAMRSTTAGRYAASSRFPADDDHQGDDAARGNCAWGLRRLPHGHVAHVGVLMDHKDRAAALPKSDVTSLLNWRGLTLASLSRNSHWLPSPSLATDRRVLSPSRMGIRHTFPAARRCAERGAFIRANFAGANRLCVRNTLPNQHVSQAVADRLHHQTFLFRGCAVREASCATKGLGNVRKAFGELRNV